MSMTRSERKLQDAHAAWRFAWNMLGDAAAALRIVEETLVASPSSASLVAPVFERIRARAAPARVDGRGDLAAMVQSLELVDRAAFLLRVVEEVSAQDTAEVLGMTAREVRSRTHRATLLLMGMLSARARAAA
jgi:DNA-directed RNA polymerase specialized sigma24 family protein